MRRRGKERKSEEKEKMGGQINAKQGRTKGKRAQFGVNKRRVKRGRKT